MVGNGESHVQVRNGRFSNECVMSVLSQKKEVGEDKEYFRPNQRLQLALSRSSGTKSRLTIVLRLDPAKAGYHKQLFQLHKPLEYLGTLDFDSTPSVAFLGFDSQIAPMLRAMVAHVQFRAT